MKHGMVVSIILSGSILAVPGISKSQAAFTAGTPQGLGEASSAAHEVPLNAGNSMITLDVVVTDKAGSPIAGLAQKDFRVLDNDEASELAGFQAGSAMTARPDPPVKLIVLIDAVNSDASVTDSVREQLQSFLKRNGGELALPTSFIFLTEDAVKVEGAGNRDGNKLLKVLDENAGGLREVGRAGGGWGEAERRELSLRALSMIAKQERKVPGRKLLIWISPGWAAFAGSSWMKSDKDNQQLFSYIANFSTDLREARITLYSVDTPDAAHIGGNNFSYRNYLKGISNPKQTEYGDVLLQVLASQSGGQVVFGSNDLSHMIDQCTAEARSFYTISFKSAQAKVPNEYHKLSIEIDKAEFSTRTRTGYYAQP